MILFLLVADIRADCFLVAAHRVHEKPSCPEMLAYEIALPLSEATDLEEARDSEAVPTGNGGYLAE